VKEKMVTSVLVCMAFKRVIVFKIC